MLYKGKMTSNDNIEKKYFKILTFQNRSLPCTQVPQKGSQFKSF